MTVLDGRVGVEIADALTQSCPINPEHRIRPVEVDIRRTPGGGSREIEARLLGVCSQCWPVEVTLLETTVPVAYEQVRDWALDWLVGLTGPRERSR